jgi:hypothetical protein
MKKADDEAEKAERTLDYGAMKPKKTPEAEAPKITYSGAQSPSRTPGSTSTEAGFKAPKEKTKVLQNPAFRTKLAEQRKAHGIKKSEASNLSEALTKSMRASYSDDQIELMLKAAVDTGKAHRNILLEWKNFKTVSADLLEMAPEE